MKSKKLDLKIEKMKRRWEKLEVVPSSLRPGALGGGNAGASRDAGAAGSSGTIGALAALRSKATSGQQSTNRTTNRLPPSREQSSKAPPSLGAAGLTTHSANSSPLGSLGESPAAGSSERNGVVTFAQGTLDRTGTAPGAPRGGAVHRRTPSVTRSVSLPSFGDGAEPSGLAQRLEAADAGAQSGSSQQLQQQGTLPNGRNPRPRTGAIGNFPSPAALAAAASAAATRATTRLGSLGSLETISRVQSGGAAGGGGDDALGDSEGLSHPLLDMVAIVFKLQAR